jgi:hypothetical protein
MLMFYKDQKVQTPHGKGSIVGFEKFNTKGFSDHHSDTDIGGRIIVKLEQPHTWKPTAMTPDPYYFRREVEALPPKLVIKGRTDAQGDPK